MTEMTDKEFMEALLAGRSVADCHDTCKYQLNSEGYLFVVGSEEIHITAKDVVLKKGGDII